MRSFDIETLSFSEPTRMYRVKLKDGTVNTYSEEHVMNTPSLSAAIHRFGYAQARVLRDESQQLGEPRSPRFRRMNHMNRYCFLENVPLTVCTCNYDDQILEDHMSTDISQNPVDSGRIDEDAALDHMVQAASTPSLATLFQNAKDAGLIKPAVEYGGASI